MHQIINNCCQYTCVTKKNTTYLSVDIAVNSIITVFFLFAHVVFAVCVFFSCTKCSRYLNQMIASQPNEKRRFVSNRSAVCFLRLPCKTRNSPVELFEKTINIFCDQDVSLLLIGIFQRVTTFLLHSGFFVFAAIKLRIYYSLQCCC